MQKSISQIFNLDGKKALVTGCSRGIGKAIAVGLAQAGCQIIGVSKSLPLGDSDIKIEVENAGQTFFPFQCDFSDRKDVHRFLEKINML